jgi:signal transduction histidine kinase
MLMPPSSEFVALCQLQVNLLTRGLGAALSIIYLTEELTDVTDAKMVPVTAYPEAVASWGEDQILSLLSRSSQKRSAQWRSLPQGSAHPGTLSVVPLQPAIESGNIPLHPLEAAERALSRQQQIVLPLIHEEVVMGLLVTARADRAWTEIEQTQIEQIADSLALACVLDQRSQWMAQDLRQQRLLREQRRDLFDNLLHQVRNPLTAMRTFGKLLVKRMRPGDVNRTAAEGIVRESDRLQELLKQFDTAVDLDETELSRLLSGSEDSAWPEALPQSAPSLPLLSAGTVSSSSASSAPNTNLLIGTAIQLEPHPIAEVLLPLLDSAKAIAQDRSLTLQLEVPPNLPPVQMDVRALREVLSNLIDNALKYTPAGGQVAIRIYSQSSRADAADLADNVLPPVVSAFEAIDESGDESVDQSGARWQAIAILDTGPGIPSQDLEHLFERHYRGVQAATNIPGTGLGLAIARDLVHQMQGEIRIFSPAYTSGLVAPPQPFTAESTPKPATLPRMGTVVIVWLKEVASDNSQSAVDF